VHKDTDLSEFISGKLFIHLREEPRTSEEKSKIFLRNPDSSQEFIGNMQLSVSHSLNALETNDEVEALQLFQSYKETRAILRRTQQHGYDMLLNQGRIQETISIYHDEG
jgi:hypothetical protein